MKPIFEAWMKPLHDLGMTSIALHSTRGTDHLPFDWIGIPGFQFVQDPLDYSPQIHHTNQDVIRSLCSRGLGAVGDRHGQLRLPHGDERREAPAQAASDSRGDAIDPLALAAGRTSLSVAALPRQD